MLESKRKVIGIMIVNQNFAVFALSETKLKGKSECEFGFIYLVI